MSRLLLAGEELLLLPQRAAYLPARRTLLVADVHLGKAASFRRLGVPVPEATTEATLQRLSAALQASAAECVIVLGDLVHAELAGADATRAAVDAWRRRHRQLDLVLVRGNHDRNAGDPPADWGVRSTDEPLHLAGLALLHHPRAVPGAYALGGHLHPCAVLGGRAGDRVRLPCFHFGAAYGVLPAFGEFTGMHALARGDGDRVFVVHGDAVRRLPGRRGRGHVPASL